jgi:PadR family transcriptional regulator, regulatory protein PadR
MGEGKSEVLQGTLDLMVLKTLYAMGPQHGSESRGESNR